MEERQEETVTVTAGELRGSSGVKFSLFILIREPEGSKGQSTLKQESPVLFGNINKSLPTATKYRQDCLDDVIKQQMTVGKCVDTVTAPTLILWYGHFYGKRVLRLQLNQADLGVTFSNSQSAGEAPGLLYLGGISVQSLGTPVSSFVFPCID